MAKEVVQGIVIGLFLIVAVAATGSYIACNVSEGHHEAEHVAEEDSADEPLETVHVPAPQPADQMRTVELTDAKIGQGEELFGQCAACHGEDGEGKLGVGPALTSATFLAGASDRFLIETIENGRPGTPMTAYGNSMEADDIEAIVAFLRSRTETEPAELDESELDGDEQEGAKLYADICAGCHGETGAGYAETRNGTGIGRQGFLRTATNGFLRHIIRHGKSGTQMRPFAPHAKTAVANLTNREIEDIITYLRHNAR